METSISCADLDGDTGGPDNPQSSNTGPDPLKIQKATKPVFNVMIKLAYGDNWNLPPPST